MEVFLSGATAPWFGLLGEKDLPNVHVQLSSCPCVCLRACVGCLTWLVAIELFGSREGGLLSHPSFLKGKRDAYLCRTSAS